MSTWQSAVSARILAVRKQRGLSLSALAARASVSKATLSGIESGHGNPTLDTIECLARALALPVSDLLVSEERSVSVHRAPEDSDDQITQDLMLRFAASRGWEFWRLRMPAGSTFEGVHHVRGTVELILLLGGSLHAGPHDAEYDLQAGDLLEFSGDCAHSYVAGPQGVHCLVALGSHGDSDWRAGTSR